MSEDREIFLTKINENKSLAYLKLQQVLVNTSPRKPNFVLQKHVFEDRVIIFKEIPRESKKIVQELQMSLTLIKSLNHKFVVVLMKKT